MQPSPNQATVEPLIEVMDQLAPVELHTSAWAACSKNAWCFGHGSHEADWSRFWKMNLDGDPAFDAIWQHVRPRCEALAGAPLRVIRQYANGHTFGLGGNPHLDDTRPGTFTLLYYPNLEWKDEWDGETVFLDPNGEIALSVRPRPNRAVLFDSRIPHAGRAPSRRCPALRVTVAYKLEALGAPSAQVARTSAGEKSEPVELKELSRDGANRMYSVRIESSLVHRAVQEQLAKLATTVRLPGFRPGKVPPAVLEERYGPVTRTEILNRMANEAVSRCLPRGSVPSSLELKAGTQSGDAEFQIAAAFLPDLPPIDYSQWTVERLPGEDTQLKKQVLDRLDAAYRFPLLPAMVDREFSAIWKAAESEIDMPEDAAGIASVKAEFRVLAERRLRLGLIVTEFARRYEINAAQGADLEDLVIGRIISQTTEGR